MKAVHFVLTLLVLSLVAPLQSAKAADVICYNCPPEWADRASMLKAIKTDLNYDIPHDNKNSGQALAQILAEKSNPVGMVGYLDPSSAAVGYVGAVAINLALGGSAANFDPAIAFFKELRKNDPIVPKQTSYARVVSGEMPILLDYDFNAYRAKYSEKGSFEFVIPCEGSVTYPYVVGLVKNAPDKDKAKKVLDYLLSDKGQAIWTNAYLRPARPIELPEAVKRKFLPDSDYARARNVDWGQMEGVQKGFVDRYLAEVR